MRTLAMILTPVACFLWYDFGYHLKLILDGDGVQYVSFAVSVTVIVGIGLILSSSHEKTAWNPKGMHSALFWCLGAILGVGACVALGFLSKMTPLYPVMLFCLEWHLCPVEPLLGELAITVSARLREHEMVGHTDRGCLITSSPLWALLLGYGLCTGFKKR